jgi:DNA-directed RNA polymerase subunit RPC12/RpoP
MIEVKCANCVAEFCEDDIRKTPVLCPRREIVQELRDAKERKNERYV